MTTSLCAVLLAEACNTGLEPLIRLDTPALRRSRLSWVRQNYIRADTLVRSNATLVAAQAAIPLARAWGGGDVASADGLRFVVPVQTIHSGPNPRYFGQERGITYYNLTSDQFTGLGSIVVPGTLRDSLALLSVLLEQETALQPTEVMTDTGAYTGSCSIFSCSCRGRRLDVIPAQFRMLVTKRPKLACQACEGQVVQAPAPPRLIEGGIPTEAMVAHVVVSRFGDHQPLYRQVQIIGRQGVVLDRSTLAFWVGYAAAEVAPVVARLRELVLGSARIFADETVVPVLDPGRGKTKQGYFWAVARDDRPWGGADPPAVVYTYAPGRGEKHASKLLGGYRGILQCDGYAAYKQVAASKSAEGGITLAFCWSHVRRGFYDQAKTKTAPIATEALERIAALYRIEAEIRGKGAEVRQVVRHERSRPLVEAMRQWLEAQLPKLARGSPTADAIRYALNHWDGLARFLDDGRIELDSNSVERAMRPVALSRKNSLFAGSDGGARHWALAMTLIQTAKLNGVDPMAWLTDVLERIVTGRTKAHELHTLLPWNWREQIRAETAVPAPAIAA